MSQSENDRCRRCGAEIPPESTERLCPACLLSGALGMPDSVAETIASLPDEPQSTFEPSEFPCEFGGYRLLGLLGSGGMGTVYEAEHLATGRRVALKMLGQQIDTPELRKRFLREGRLAAGVNHPNSLYIFGSEEIEGHPVITMEIAGSGTLQDRLNRRGPLPVAEAVDAILDVISGLESAFSGGVLHRDIKPSNCFVSADGSVKVGDFGLSVSTLARSETFVTTLGRIMGTPAYASPEQLRGDPLDIRSDIYSVGATLFTLLTNRAPFEGENAVQVVLNAVNQKPRPLSEFREDVPPGLEKVVSRCLSKEPGRRYADYTELRSVLLPFSSREPEPASIKLRASAGWIDYLIAFLIPYVALMLLIGNEEFHFRLFLERTLYAARYHIVFLCFGFLYFTIAEGIWGAGLGKRLKGLRVVRTDGRVPGLVRAFIRILLPVLLIEGIRIPILLATITATRIEDLTWQQIAIYSAATYLCPWIPALLALRARPQNGYATLWDLASGTRVVILPEGSLRPSLEPEARLESGTETAELVGPYQLIREVVPGKWRIATDPLLSRQVWLLRHGSAELSPARQSLSRHSRLRWLQNLQKEGVTWHVFEATPGIPFSSVVEEGKRVPWSTLRHWLHDLASELWAASGDRTLPSEISLDHIWITSKGNAVLLDEPWPEVKKPAKRFPAGDVAGQQSFLDAVAQNVEATSLPVHARRVLQNLEKSKFEKLSFLAGVLRGLLDKPAEVSRGIRAGSIFLIPAYIWIIFFVGLYTGEGARRWLGSDSTWWVVLATVLLVMGGAALLQLLEVPFRTTVSQSIFRLAIVNAKGELAGRGRLLKRWAVSWLPLLFSLSLAALLLNQREEATVAVAVILLFLWIAAALFAVVDPNQGLQDRLAGTWVVRQ